MKKNKKLLGRKCKKYVTLKHSKRIAREINKTNDKELEKVLAKKMISLYNFIDDKLKIGFKINLESHNFNHANPFLTIIPIHPDSGIETNYNNKMFKEMATIYARLKNPHKYKYHILFSASFYKTDEEVQRSDETDLFINLNMNHSFTRI